MNDDHRTHRDSGIRSNANWVLIGFIAIVGYFLITEHKAHLSGMLSYLPFLLLLACPLLHVFMHGRHGGYGEHGGHSGHAEREKRTREVAPRGDGK